MPTSTITIQGSAPINDRGVIFSASGAPPLFKPLLDLDAPGNLEPPPGGLDFAIQFRCYPMPLLLTLAFILLFSSCQSAVRPLELPAATEGGWRRSSLEALDASKKPEWMARLGVKDSKRATFTGPIDVEVDFYEMSSSAAALECSQLWKKLPAETFVMRDNYFLVIRSQHPNRESLMDFSRGLEKALAR